MGRIIITIDGGGVRGVMPLVLLREISRASHTELNQLEIEWWGTSTGSIISGGLCKLRTLPFEVAVQNVLDLYELRSAPAINPGKVSQPARAFNQLIAANFKGLAMHEFPQFRCVVAEIESGMPVIIDQHWPVDLDQAIRASCAFPGLFPPVNLNGQTYVDGYIQAKNPTMLAFEYHQKQGMTPDLILSLGTGVMRAHDPVEQKVQEIDLWMKQQAISRNIPYFRLNPTLEKAVDNMQNSTPKNIHHLKLDSMQFIQENKETFREIGKIISDY